MREDLHHETRKVFEDHILTLREFGTEERTEEVLVESDGAVQHPLAVERFHGFDATTIPVEHVEGRWVFDIHWVDDEKPFGKASGIVRVKAFESGNRAYQIPLTVDHYN